MKILLIALLLISPTNECSVFQEKIAENGMIERHYFCDDGYIFATLSRQDQEHPLLYYVDYNINTGEPAGVLEDLEEDGLNENEVIYWER